MHYACPRRGALVVLAGFSLFHAGPAKVRFLLAGVPNPLPACFKKVPLPQSAALLAAIFKKHFHKLMVPHDVPVAAHLFLYYS